MNGRLVSFAEKFPGQQDSDTSGSSKREENKISTHQQST